MPGRKPQGRTGRTFARRDGDSLKLVSQVAIESLVAQDGYASGVKFNKLVFHLHKTLAKSPFAFRLPHRWYLYGAVVDIHPLFGYVVARDPEEEMLTDLTWNADHSRVNGPEGMLEEIGPLAKSFAARFAGKPGIAPMLREHYKDAPLDFQREYLEWSLAADDIVWGRATDSPAALSRRFARLQETFPADLEPRLAPAFNRLALFLEPLVAERRSSDLDALKFQAEAVRQFWRTFCLFLSLKYHADLPGPTVEHYRQRADEEIVWYKRRLSAFLTNGYVEEAFDAARAREVAEEDIGETLSGAIRTALSDGESD